MISRSILLALVVSCAGFVQAQEETPTTPPADSPAVETAPVNSDAPSSNTSTTDKVKVAAEKGLEKTAEEVTKIAKKVDQDPRAKDAAAGVLQPIYLVAKALAFPAFHWIAFALMAAGVVSYALQLALGKLVVLTQLGFSLKEIASDAVGLAISVVGLVLTTQAAAENSTFTQSPTAVLSSTAAGVIVGIILYFWGQSQELEAAAGRSRSVVHAKK